MIAQLEQMDRWLEVDYKDKKKLYQKSDEIVQALKTLGLRTEPVVNPKTNKPEHSWGFISRSISQQNQIDIEWNLMNWQVDQYGNRRGGNGYGELKVCVQPNEKTFWYAENRKTNTHISVYSDMIPASIIEFINQNKDLLEVR